ncbi:MAG: hypothetical protein M1818_006741 [Claussenomyces sp. TS43310]|nr:MAG: hypothetical protein M1818_006741 [Claussenomyces sp. TS43310]
MAHKRMSSLAAAADIKEPHSISLKVLRLSRPTLATQHPLPAPSAASTLASAISPTASVAYPSSYGHDSSFAISPLLTLPPSFGNAYVGETFACTLCANHELPPPEEGGSGEKRIHNVRIEAEMKTPSLTLPLDVAFAEPSAADDLSREGQEKTDLGSDLDAGKSLQGIVDFHLKEEGNHVLAVTVSYTETGPTSGRVRSFRKLYQFVARGCLVVRTKITQIPAGKKPTSRASWSLEAQLENCGEDMIVLDEVSLDEKGWCAAKSLNWDTCGSESSVAGDGGDVVNPILGPGDVHQVCFLVAQNGDEVGELDAAGRLIVGMLRIGWRGAMGNKGNLSTGWLGTRLR